MFYFGEQCGLCLKCWFVINDSYYICIVNVFQDRLQFSENGRTTNIGDPEAFMLIIGIFLSRSLITTLLMKPVDYGLSNQQLTDVGERNLKVIATTMLYLVRRVSVSRGRAMMVYDVFDIFLLNYLPELFYWISLL